MKKTENCRLCGESNLQDKYLVNGFTISKCRACSLVFVREIVENEYLRQFYTLTPEQRASEKTRGVYLDASNERNLKFAYKGVADRIKMYFRNQSNLRILDLGCSNGSFLDLFSGWDVHGIELEEAAGRIAKSKHPNVFIGDMKDAYFENNFFDCISIQDALDHSNDPYTVVKHSHALLKPNGLIVIKVHNINCLLAKITGKKFYAIIPPGHLTYFNLKTLKLLLAKNSFEYFDHYYNTQKLRLDTAFIRASVTFPWLSPFQKILSKTFLANIPFYKNYHDIITIMGVKMI